MSKKAVIETGGKQYLVSEGQTLEVEIIKGADKKVEFSPLLVLDGDKIEVGRPQIAKVKVSAQVLEQEAKAEKVTAIRYKAKKRVRKIRGHRQRHTSIKILSIA